MSYEEAYRLLERTIGEEILALKTLSRSEEGLSKMMTETKIKVLYKVMDDFFENAKKYQQNNT